MASNFVERNFARVKFPGGGGELYRSVMFQRQFSGRQFYKERFPSTFSLKGAEETTFYYLSLFA